MYISLYVQMAIVVFLELKLIVFSNPFRVMNIKKCKFLKTETNGVSRYENWVSSRDGQLTFSERYCIISYTSKCQICLMTFF